MDYETEGHSPVKKQVWVGWESGMLCGWGQRGDVEAMQFQMYELQDVAMEMEMEKWCNQGVGKVIIP